MNRRAVLLLNVGTPEAPTPAAVRVYLREFLSDPKVIDIHPVARWLLLNVIILPTRSGTSAKLYQNIWTENGSPLLIHSRAQQAALQAKLPDDEVILAMRYGNPSIASAMKRIAQLQLTEVVVVPLYPQYSSAATQSSLDAAAKHIAGLEHLPSMKVVEPFYRNEGFLEAQAQLISSALQEVDADHVLFSYHGLPVRQVQATAATEHGCHGGLGTTECCAAITATNQSCYRAQCFATSRSLVARLSLKSHSTSFQSRLGRTPWIQPYTDFHLPELAQRGIKRLVVACPSFVADCLETLEEVGIRAREQWKTLGGERLELVRCVNEHPLFIDALAALTQKEAPR